MKKALSMMAKTKMSEPFRKAVEHDFKNNQY